MVDLVCRIPAAPGPARLLDISTGGCRLDTQRRICEQGSSIVLEIANGDRVQGLVTWQHHATVGVRFARPLNPKTAAFLGIPADPAEAQSDEAEYGISPIAEEGSGPGAILRHWFRKLALPSRG